MSRRNDGQIEVVKTLSTYTIVCDNCGAECGADAPSRVQWFELLWPALDDFEYWDVPNVPVSPADLCSAACVSEYAVKAKEFADANT